MASNEDSNSDIIMYTNDVPIQSLIQQEIAFAPII